MLRLVAEEFRRMKEEPVSEEELRRAKDHLKGSLVLSLESSGSRMSSLARQEMYLKRFYTIEELQTALEAVTREAGAGNRARILPAGADCGDGGGPAGRLPAAAGIGGLLKR